MNFVNICGLKQKLPVLFFINSIIGYILMCIKHIKWNGTYVKCW